MTDSEVADPAEELVERVAAIDIAKASGMVCMRLPHPSRAGRRTQEVWNVPATMNCILELGDRLVCQGGSVRGCLGATSAVDSIGSIERHRPAPAEGVCTPYPGRRPGGQTAFMQLPTEAVTATVLIEVVRISALPTRRDVPYPGTAVAHWAGSEAAAALALIESLPGSEQHRCGFSPGWSVRAYEDSLDLALFEAAFCFTCHEVRMQGTAVPPALATQFFDPDTLPARTLLSLFRKAAP